MQKQYTRRAFLKTCGKGLSALALLSGPLRFFAPAQAEEGEMLSANALIHGEEQLKVAFLERHNEEKSDSFLILYLSEKGLDVTLHDGGLNDRQTYQALLNLREEIPHGVGVEMLAITKLSDRLTEIHANVYCERASHRSIIIGKQGTMLQRIGSQARVDIERLLDTKVMLKLWVKVREDWRNRTGDLRAQGYED